MTACTRGGLLHRAEVLTRPRRTFGMGSHDVERSVPWPRQDKRHQRPKFSFAECRLAFPGPALDEVFILVGQSSLPLLVS